MTDTPDDDALVAALKANDVEATWCGPDGLFCRAAARIEALAAELEAAYAAIRDAARNHNMGGDWERHHADVIARAMGEKS